MGPGLTPAQAIPAALRGPVERSVLRGFFMHHQRLSLATLVAVACLALPGAATAFAFAKGNSNLTLTDLLITPQSGVASFTDPWLVGAYAHAASSAGEQTDAPPEGQDTSLSASTSVPYAWATGSSSPSARTLAATAAIDIPDVTAWAESNGRGYLDTWFQLTGGSGDVSTSISYHAEGHQDVRTGDRSDAATQVILTLALYEDTGTDFVNVLNLNDSSLLSIGPNSHAHHDISTTYSSILSLKYDTWYRVYWEADSETRGQTPIPPSLILTATGLFAMAGLRRRLSNHRVVSVFAT